MGGVVALEVSTSDSILMITSSAASVALFHISSTHLDWCGVVLELLTCDSILLITSSAATVAFFLFSIPSSLEVSVGLLDKNNTKLITLG